MAILQLSVLASDVTVRDKEDKSVSPAKCGTCPKMYTEKTHGLNVHCARLGFTADVRIHRMTRT